MDTGFWAQMNELGRRRIPFLFVIDFEKQQPQLWPLSALPEGLRYAMPENSIPPMENFSVPEAFRFRKTPPDPESYRTAFEKVTQHLQRGDTYLLNLTFPTMLDCSLGPEEIFQGSRAPYKLWIDGEFICFSPEIFIRIHDNRISSYPMKGTIDASLPDAESRILGDEKETAEHNTIIDLIRNDLSIVASEVRLVRYRYLDRIRTHESELLQVSSTISGRLPEDWPGRLGDILDALLPAGSVSGAPKARTLEIIREAEGGARGYYTGVFGVFDGETLDSAVMIRYIELKHNQMVFRSGGGITAKSQWKQEYDELIQKVYVPFA